jgi:hypothetical protein
MRRAQRARERCLMRAQTRRAHVSRREGWRRRARRGGAAGGAGTRPGKAVEDAAGGRGVEEGHRRTHDLRARPGAISWAGARQRCCASRGRSTAGCADGQRAPGSAARPPGLVSRGIGPAWVLSVRDAQPRASLHGQSAAHPLWHVPRCWPLAAIRLPHPRASGSLLQAMRLTPASCTTRRCRTGTIPGAGRPTGALQAGPRRAPRAASCCVS